MTNATNFAIRDRNDLRAVLTGQDGLEVEHYTRCRMAIDSGLMSDRMLRLAACEMAERELLAERAAGREPDQRSLAAVDMGRRHADGLATDGELAETMLAACQAAQESPLETSRFAAWRAAQAASRDAAKAVAWAGSAEAVIASKYPSHLGIFLSAIDDNT